MSLRSVRRAALPGAVLGVGLAILAAAGFALLDRLLPFPLERLARTPATLVVDRSGEPLRLFLPPDGIVRLPVPLESVSPEMRRALVASEDGRVVGVVTRDGPAAGSPHLAQNHPNPCTHDTTIRFALSGSGPARLAVYDISGRHVRTLSEGALGEGAYSVVWDGRDADDTEA